MTESTGTPVNAMWAVIAPDGTLSWYTEADTQEVEALVAGAAPGATDTRWLGPQCPGVKLMASDVGLLMPDDFPVNPVAEQTIAALSGGYVMQPWRGHVTIYEHDEGFAEPMSEAWVLRIRAAHAAVTADDQGSG